MVSNYMVLKLQGDLRRKNRYRHLGVPCGKEPEGSHISSLCLIQLLSEASAKFPLQLRINEIIFFSYLEKLLGKVPKTVVEGTPLSAFCIPADSPYLLPVLHLSLDTGRLGYKPKGFWS